MKKICINCGNLHNGGGVQVATSFIYELSKNVNFGDLNISVNVSSEVRDNLESLDCDLSRFSDVSNLNTYGLSTLHKNIRDYYSKFDIIFTVFGPDYLFFAKKTFKITGFAQPWIVYPNNEVYARLSLKLKIKNILKFYLQRKLFGLSSHIVVEIDYVKRVLCTLPEFKNIPIDVVNNTISSIYINKNNWQSIKKINQQKFSVGFLGRDHIHKNTNLLLEIKNELYKTYNKDVAFYVTFNDREWERKSDEFRSNINNVGSLSVSQCPNFYESMDAVIFPSLLECFSATPLEAMAMEKPLFASDREFVRDVCHDYALYFDPTSAISAANVINSYIENVHENDSLRLKNAKLHALDFSNPTQRAEQYLNIIRSVNKIS